MKVFIFGTCRIWLTSYLNNWADEDSTIQSHYADEINQYINWLITKKELSDDEKQSFRNNMTDDHWNKLIRNFNSVDTIFVEVSSLKVKQNEGMFLNILNNQKFPEIIEKDIYKKIEKIYDSLTSLGKTIVFFSHANLYSKRKMGFIKNRTIIQENFRIAKKHRNIKFIDPSELVSIHGQNKCMKLLKSGEYDSNHYTDFMINLIGETIVNIL